MRAGDVGSLSPWHLHHGVDGHRGGGQKEGAAAWNSEIFMLGHLPGRSVYRSSPPFDYPHCHRGYAQVKRNCPMMIVHLVCGQD